jgi:hypothetical protein
VHGVTEQRTPVEGLGRDQVVVVVALFLHEHAVLCEDGRLVWGQLIGMVNHRSCAAHVPTLAEALRGVQGGSLIVF